MDNEELEVQKAVENTDACWQQELKDKKRKGLWWKVLLGIFGFLLIGAVTAGVILWHLNVFQVQLMLQGEREMTVEYGNGFEDPGAQAQFQGTLLFRQPQNVQVQSDGAVDVSKVGTYQLSYYAAHKLDLWITELVFEAGANRLVHVVDTQLPVITLTVNEGVYTIPGQPYEEEGYTATDNYDGDITANVVRTEADGTVRYTVADSSGNTAEVVRNIVYHDPVPPELMLAGNADVSITQGNAYNEPGYTATDNCDGDLTEKVTVSGAVDVNTPGTYTLQYSVTDSYNNTTMVTRTIRVNPPVPVLPMPDMPAGNAQTPVTPNGKVIYLTFDDGPTAHTERLLDILDRYNVKATFFVVKTGYLHLLPRMAAAGHTIAMHSATHNYSKIYANENAYFNDLYDMQNTINAYTGLTPTILRFPGGSSNTVSRINQGIMTRLTASLRSMGYRYFDWNVDSRDAGGASSSHEVYYNVINGCSKKNVSIVLQHDTRGFSVDAVEWIIGWGIANGYTFLPLDASSPVCEHNLNN